MESRPSSKSSDTTLYDQYADLEKFQRFPDPSKETLHTWISRVTLAMLTVLALATIGGLVVSGLVFGQSVTISGQCASQSFVLFASLLAMPYVGLHIQAARLNFSVVRGQPFQHPLHSWVIIVARIDFIAWIVGLVASSVSLAKTKGEKAHLQGDVAICVLASLAMTFCICVVEKATEPFVLPWISPSRMYVCRISKLGSAILVDDSISRRASIRSPQIHIRPNGVPAPGGPRPLERGPTAVIEPEDALPRTNYVKPDHERSETKPLGPRIPEPTYQPASKELPAPQYLPPMPQESRGWRDDWSEFAGEAGLRKSGSVSEFTIASATTSTVSTGPAGPPAPPAPSVPTLPTASYNVWVPTKRNKHARAHSATSSSSKRPLLPTVSEIMTPLTESSIDDYLGPWSPAPIVKVFDGDAKEGTVGLGITSPEVKPTGSFKRERKPTRAKTLRTPEPLKQTKVAAKPEKNLLEVKEDKTKTISPKVPGSFVE